MDPGTLSRQARTGRRKPAPEPRGVRRAQGQGAGRTALRRVPAARRRVRPYRDVGRRRAGADELRELPRLPEGHPRALRRAATAGRARHCRQLRYAWLKGRTAMQHDIVSGTEWLAARQALLAEEKKLAELRARIVEQRHALPWTLVDKAYAFDTPAGRQTLGELFEGRGRLIVYHFMFAPDWTDGCPGCS